MDYSCFANKVCVITGAGGEIGGGTARQLARWGAKLALLDNDEGRLEDIKYKCSEAGLKKNKMFFMHGDLLQEETVTQFVDGLVKQFGEKVDFLLNVVGTKKISTMENCSVGDLKWVLEGNIVTTFMMTKACRQYLINAKGCVINLSSYCALRPQEVTTAYCVAKAGVESLTRCNAMELAKYGVRVNAIQPGPLISRNNLTSGCFKSEEQLENYFKAAARHMPLGWVGNVEDHIVPLIMFMASDKATFICGSVIPVEAGYNNTVGP